MTNQIISGVRDDLFIALKYETRPGKRGTVIGRPLGQHFVFRWIFQESWQHFSASVETVNKGNFHSSEALFNDPERWAELKKSHHIAIGRCLAFFVREEMLPLACVNPHANNKLYRVIYQLPPFDNCGSNLNLDCQPQFDHFFKGKPPCPFYI